MDYFLLGILVGGFICMHPTRELAQMTADFKVSGGNVQLVEEDGIDYAPVTVQLPGGERVAFLFTIKQLDAKGTLDSFSGDFTVPSYRGSSFLDPKVCWRLGRVLVGSWVT